MPMFPMTSRGGGVYDPSKRGYYPQGLPSPPAGYRSLNVVPAAASSTLAPLPVQFPVRSQMFNESSYGAVSRRMSDEDKTGTLGGTARRRGASRALLG